MNFLWIPYIWSPKFPFVTPTESFSTLLLLHKFTWEICKGFDSGCGLRLDKQLPERLCNKSFLDKSHPVSAQHSPLCISLLLVMQCSVCIGLLRELQGRDLKETECLYQSSPVVFSKDTLRESFREF